MKAVIKDSLLGGCSEEKSQIGKRFESPECPFPKLVLGCKRMVLLLPLMRAHILRKPDANAHPSPTQLRC
jgi:hypothetical protein